MAKTFLTPTWFQAPVLLLILLCQGCTKSIINIEKLAPDEAACLIWYQRLDTLFAEHELIDPSLAKITGFPYLRADRFFASFRSQNMTDDAYAEWLERMRQLDASLRLSEAASLPPDVADYVLAEAPLPGSLQQVLQQCGKRLVKAVLHRPEYKPFLRQQIHTLDIYKNWQRIVGAYWIMQYPARLALKNLHKKLAQNFARNLNDIPLQSRLIRYAPEQERRLSASEIDVMLRVAYQNPLGIPTLSDEQLGRLFAHFAPIWEIDTRNDTDKIGTVLLNNQGDPRIDTQYPVVYQKHAYTRWQGRILLQLIYQIWFPAREKIGLTDMFGGELDSVIWRVTLSPEGVPIAYDSIHACGCYYLLFPSKPFRSIPPKDGAEAVLSPKSIPSIPAGQRLLLRIESRTHYLLQTTVITDTDNTMAKLYHVQAYDALLSLTLPDGSRRSLFGSDGIIAASTRPERFLLWPFGVPNPGAMRQWGVHAISFTGKRYFDDPFLFEKLIAVE